VKTYVEGGGEARVPTSKTNYKISKKEQTIKNNISVGI